MVCWFWSVSKKKTPKTTQSRSHGGSSNCGYSKTPQEDVQRRDFTINGLLMRHDNGEVLDFIGGQADLKAGIIRAIGEPGRRFAEDKLRMMRAVRFAARFGFEIETETFRAVRSHVEEIHQISPERLREELLAACCTIRARSSRSPLTTVPARSTSSPSFSREHPRHPRLLRRIRRPQAEPRPDGKART